MKHPIAKSTLSLLILLSFAAHAAGPELTRRGLLLGAGSVVTALSIPITSVPLLPRRPLTKILHISKSTFLFVDEAMGLSAEELANIRSRVSNVTILGGAPSASLNLSVELVEEEPWSRFSLLDRAGKTFSKGLTRVVGHQTMQTIEGLSLRTPTLSTEKLLRILESLEPTPAADCDSVLLEPTQQDLLLIDREESAN